MPADSFPLARFRILYPMFDGVESEVVLAVAEAAICYMGRCGGDCEDQLWMLLVAHMLQLRADQDAGNGKPGAVVSASINNVSVSFATPPAGSAADHWFGLTPFGQQYLALAARCAATIGAGFYVGSMPERAAFRSVGGRFPRGGRSW